MQAVGVPGDAITYSMLIRACEKGGQGQKAKEFKDAVGR
jgi:pentatricopeptide repeat protein